MNKKITKFVAIAAAVLMLPVTTFAANFKDIKDTYWAKSYIEQCADLGFINGFPDGKFKPNEPVRFTELIKMLSNFLNVSEADMQSAESTYGPTLNSVKPTPWVRPYLLKCLQKKVVSLELLNSAAKKGKPSMIKDNAQYQMSRISAVDLFFNAMGLDKVPTALQYKDSNVLIKNYADQIPKIGALQKAGVLSTQGDESGNFRPKSTITRAEVSKMLYVAYAYIEQNGNKLNDTTVTPVPSTPSTPSAPSNLENVMGVVKSIFGMGNGQNFISINTPNNELKVYNFPANANVTVNGQTSNASNVKEGMEAVLTISGETVYNGEFKDAIKEINGTIKEIRSNNYDAKIEYKENNSTKTITLDFRNADIKLDGKTARFDELREGYEVKVTYNQDKATKVEAKKNINFAGFFEKFEYDRRSGKYRVYYRPDYNSSRTDYYELDNYVYINKSNRSVKVGELVRYNGTRYFAKGQPINFEFYRGRNDIVTGIYYDFDGNVRDGNIYGYIYNAVRRNYSTIDVSPRRYKDSYNNEVVSIRVDDYADVYLYNSNRKLNIRDLKRDMLVNIKMRDGVAVSIDILDNLLEDTINQKREFYGDLKGVNCPDSKVAGNIELDVTYDRNRVDNSYLPDDYNIILVDKYTTIMFDNKVMSNIDELYRSTDFYYYTYKCRVKTKYTTEGYLATEIVVTTNSKY